MLFEIAARRYRPAMLRNAQRLTGDATDAEDVVQDAFLLALRGWDSIAATGNVAGCLQRNVYRAFIFQKRARGAERRGSDPHHAVLEDWTEASGEDGSQEATVMLGQVRTLLGDATADDLVALAAGHTLAELGAERGLTGERVRQKLVPARTALAHAFGLALSKLSTTR